MTITSIDRRGFFGVTAAAGASALLFGRPTSAATGGHFAITHSPAQWKQMLGAQRYSILREAGTERPGSSPLLNEHRKGVFACAGCSLPLFSSATKFESGTGWPSFWKPLAHAVVTRGDRSALMARTEVLCMRCGGHLGHVFDDGPKPTGLRYCMNGLSLKFNVA
jgi:peptide-methionine (R)-S-oxide reductase